MICSVIWKLNIRMVLNCTPELKVDFLEVLLDSIVRCYKEVRGPQYGHYSSLSTTVTGEMNPHPGRLQLFATVFVLIISFAVRST